MENNNWHKQVEQQWDNRADFWNQNSENMWEKGSRSTIIPFLRGYLQPDMNILDAGCGDGYGSYKLYQEGLDVTGVDISKEMIERAKARLENERLNFIQADLSELPFDAEAFSTIMAINSLEWTANPLQAINECSRILKPNGFLCVGLLGPTAGPRQNAYRRLYGEDVICNTMMPWEFQQLVMENGFEVIDGQGVYKNAVDSSKISHFPLELKQALTFMWVYILKKKG